MKKIIFVFLLFYSSLVFSESFEELQALYSERHPEYSLDYLVGKVGTCIVPASPIFVPSNLHGGQVLGFPVINFFSNSDGDCIVIGWQKFLFINEAVGGEGYTSGLMSGNYYPNWYTALYHYEGLDILSKCPAGENMKFQYRLETKIVTADIYNSVCLSDFASDPLLYEMCAGTFPTSVAAQYRLLFCKYNKIFLSVSETTLKTKNKLTSEENSKLGSIANSKATETSLWAKIFDAFKNLVLPTQIQTPTPTPPPVIDPPPTPPPQEVAVPLSNTPVNLQVSPLMSGGGDCPTSNRITLFAHDYSISNEPFCNLARGVRSIVIASAQVGAAWLILGAL